ncbi:hypothetical protein AVEN_164802-1 [Araneus ventricosus]|uniref:Uncharacterized protein n=1 Tax=Araneus ventricosus TaxID=182803 RepID=A0A4Y2WGT2_ARAVE|nr:hypothetical protein AVEN_164802-1 [Araneus ventricosus]
MILLQQLEASRRKHVSFLKPVLHTTVCSLQHIPVIPDPDKTPLSQNLHCSLPSSLGQLPPFRIHERSSHPRIHTGRISAFMAGQSKWSI